MRTPAGSRRESRRAEAMGGLAGRLRRRGGRRGRRRASPMTARRFTARARRWRRRASGSLSAAMPPVTEDGRLLSGMRVADIGDLDLGRISRQAGRGSRSGWRRIPAESFLTVLGGDHCTAIATLAAQARRHPGLAVLVGGRASRPLRVLAWRPLDVWLRDAPCPGRVGHRTLAGRDRGGRDYDPEGARVHQRPRHAAALGARARARARPSRRGRSPIGSAGRKVHVSFDIDALDPAFAPGTEIPSSGGLSTRQALDLLAAATEALAAGGLRHRRGVAPFDSGDITTFAASR